MVILNVVSIFLLVLLGFITAKVGWTPIESSKYLSYLVVNIAMPCAIIHSLSEQILSKETVNSLLYVSALYLGLIAFSWLVSAIFTKVFKVERSDAGIYQNMITFSNNGFMGLPIVKALYGAQGFFLMVCANITFPIYAFTVGVWNVNRGVSSGAKIRVKDLLSVPIVASLIGLLIFIFQIKVPSVIDNTISFAGDMMTPISMMVIGIQLTESKVMSIIKNYKLIIAIIIKNILLPGLTLLIFLPFKGFFDTGIILVIILNALLPTAAVTVVLAESHGGNVKLASEGAFLTTLLSIGTIPLWVTLLSTLFPYTLGG